jgi:enoyl-CoA hydratase
MSRARAKLIVVEDEGPIGLLTLNRPESHNALSHALVQEAIAALEDLALQERLRVLIITGAGEEAFSAGADMRQMVELPAPELESFFSGMRKLFRLISGLPVPTIAAINGHAHGGGAEIACSCDLRLGCERSSFRFPGVAYGMAVGTWHLPTVVGLPKAKELLFTAESIDADEAVRIGLLNRKTTAADLLDSARTLAEKIADHPTAVVRSIKSLLDRTVGAPLLQRFYRELYSNQDRGVNREVQERIERILAER